MNGSLCLYPVGARADVCHPRFTETYDPFRRPLWRVWRVWLAA